MSRIYLTEANILSRTHGYTQVRTQCKERMHQSCNFSKCAGTGNLALGKPATQRGVTTPAARAVDGRRDVTERQDSCTHVNSLGQDGFWWSVVLGDLYNIAHVTITIGEQGIALFSLLLTLSLFGTIYKHSNKHDICEKRT